MKRRWETQIGGQTILCPACWQEGHSVVANVRIADEGRILYSTQVTFSDCGYVFNRNFKQLGRKMITPKFIEFMDVNHGAVLAFVETLL